MTSYENKRGVWYWRGSVIISDGALNLNSIIHRTDDEAHPECPGDLYIEVGVLKGESNSYLFNFNKKELRNLPVHIQRSIVSIA